MDRDNDSLLDMDATPTENPRIWKDSSAEEAYGNSYLDNPGTNAAIVMNMAASGPGSDRSTFTNVRATALHADIAVGALDEDELGQSASSHSAKSKAYSGRKVVWPGALFLLTIMVGATVLITYYGIQDYNAAQKQQSVTEEFTSTTPRPALPLKVCRVPDYVTVGTKLYATGGTQKHEVHFTGINWSGMENKEGVPHGLAVKQSSIDDIATRLNEMEINAVRLPLNAKMVIDDSAPNTKDFVSRLSADLYAVTSYIDMIKKVVQGLARKQIAVLLDLHKIDPEYNATTSEPLWYTDKYPEKTIIAMFEKLAKELCNEKHYNIIGVDLKNEPVGGCWPKKDNDPSCPTAQNWPRAAERMGNAILKACPNWLIVVEGLYARNIVAEMGGKNVTFDDWFGASLQNATANPIKLTPANKLVFAPHFYSPSVYPSSYYFAAQKDDNSVVTVTEYPDTDAGNTQLEAAMSTVLDSAFGGVLTNATAPVFYGEFGGIYGAHELLAGKTSTRAIDFLIKYADKKGMIGGFSWALNPDEEYAFNDAYKPKNPWKFGLFADKAYSTFNEDYAAGLKKLKGNGIIPCFSRTVSSGSASSAGSSAEAPATNNTIKAATVGPAAAATPAAAANAAAAAAAAAGATATRNTTRPAAGARRLLSSFFRE